MQTQFLLVSPVIFLLAAAARGAALLLRRLALQIHYETTISTWEKNPTPILTQRSKTEKQPGFVLGEQRTRAFGCSFSGRSAPPQWDHLHGTYSCHRGWTARRGWWCDGDAWWGTRCFLCKVKRKRKRSTRSAEEKGGVKNPNIKPRRAEKKKNRVNNGI